MAVNVPTRHASSFRVKWRIKGYQEEMPMTEKNFQHGGHLGVFLEKMVPRQSLEGEDDP